MNKLRFYIPEYFIDHTLYRMLGLFDQCANSDFYATFACHLQACDFHVLKQIIAKTGS